MGHKKKHNISQQSCRPALSEYDLANNMSKLKKYRGDGGWSTEAIYEDQQYDNGSSITRQINAPTGYSMTLDRYDRLDDKIEKLSTSNSNEHEKLRIELENKIETKLPKQWYGWTVAAIVAIVSLIYILSYKPTLEKVEDNTNSINDFNTRINTIEYTIEHQQHPRDFSEQVQK